jgi:hypothetical protein
MQRKACFSLFFSLGLLLIMTGCAGINPATTVRTANTATVYIIQPSSIVNVSFGWGVNFSKVGFQLWDNDTWIGLIYSKSYIVHHVEPGTHYFMARGGNWDIVKVEAEAGKTYYLKTTDLPGFSTPSVKLEPVNPNDPDLQTWLNNSKKAQPKNKANKRALSDAQKQLEASKAGQGELKLFPVSWAQ